MLYRLVDLVLDRGVTFNAVVILIIYRICEKRNPAELCPVDMRILPKIVIVEVGKYACETKYKIQM